MADLKPCPFCGGKAIVEGHHNRFMEWYLCSCPECHVSQTGNEYGFKFEAIEAWNRRAGNMAEYIERAEALEITTRTCGDYAAAWSEIRKLPPADVAPVVHGRWKCHGDCGVTECPVCGWSIEEYVGDYAYCPNCGAKMDGGGSDEAD